MNKSINKRKQEKEKKRKRKKCAHGTTFSVTFHLSKVQKKKLQSVSYTHKKFSQLVIQLVIQESKSKDEKNMQLFILLCPM